MRADSARAEDVRAAQHEDVDLLPVEATGDIRFTLDGGVLLLPERSRQVELYLRIPHVALEWIRSGQQYRAEIEISAKIISDGGGESRRVEARRVLRVESFEETRQLGAYSVEVLTGSVNFAPVRVEVKLSDLRAQKKTLVGLIKGSNRNGRAKGFLARPRGNTTPSRVSSLLFGAHSERADAAAVEPRTQVTLHGSTALIPNPSRFFGREHEIFPVYFEVYGWGEDGAFVADSLRHVLRYRIFRPDGTELLTARDTVWAPSGYWGRLQRFDVRGYATGTYVLAVERLDAQDEITDLAYGDFHVVWSQTSWLQDEKEIVDDARVLLPGQEFDLFQELPPGERAAYMAALWEQLGSEAQAEFRLRVRQAEARYGGLERGNRGSWSSFVAASVTILPSRSGITTGVELPSSPGPWGRARGWSSSSWIPMGSASITWATRPSPASCRLPPRTAAT
jgi:hypothetical protein